MNWRAGAALAVCVASIGGNAGAVTIRVPADQPTVIAALDLSQPGDTVLVAPGIYSDYETRAVGFNVVTSCAFLSDGVVLLSEAGPESTVLELPVPPAGASGNVMVGSNLPVGVVVEGFTVTSEATENRGLFLRDCGSAQVRDCVFRDLVTTSEGRTAGFLAQSTDIEVVDCRFERCYSVSTAGIATGDGNVLIQGTVFRDCNQAIDLAGHVSSSVEWALIEDCQFIDVSTPVGSGGAVFVWDYLLGVTVRNCVFESCSAVGNGGAVVIGGGGTKVVEGCRFASCSVMDPLSIGGSIAIAGGGVQLLGNTIVGSSQVNAFQGGAAIVFGASPSTLHNNVIAGSRGTETILVLAGNVDSECNVFWDNPDGIGDGYTPGPLDQISDPLFCDPDNGDFTVAADSPCLPANSGPCGQIGALGQGCGPVSIETESWGGIKTKYGPPIRKETE